MMTQLEAPSNKFCNLALRLFVVFLALSAAWVVIPRLFREWQRNPSTGHVPVILAVAAFLWLKAARSVDDHCISADNSNGSRVAWFLLAASFMLLGADAMFEEEFLLAFGLWLGLCGVFWLRASQVERRRARFPLFLLIFCLPLPPYVAFQYLHFPLQKLSAIWTAGMLDMLGQDARCIGTIVHIGSHSLRVVEECSGVKFLTALTFISLLAGYLRLRSSYVLRVFLFAAAVPLAILTNVLRLTIAGEIMVWSGPEAAMAFIHNETILVFYLGAIALQLMLTRLLEGMLQASPVRDESSTNSSAECSDLTKIGFCGASIVTSLWFIVVLTGSVLATRPPPANVMRPGLQSLVLCPSGFARISADESLLQPPYTPGFLQAVQHQRQQLKTVDGRQVDVEIAWWPGRRPRNRLIVFHQSVICSAGRYAAAVHGERSFGEGAIAHSRLQTPAGPVSLWYWLQSEDRISTQPYSHAVWQYLREIRGLSADGCFVLLAVQEKGTSGMDSELSRLVKHLRITLDNWFHTKPLFISEF